MFKDKLHEQYLGRGGHDQWSYQAPDYELMDKVVAFLRGMKLQPKEPLTLFGRDKTAGEGENRYKPSTLNEGEIRKYNPYLAEKYAGRGNTGVPQGTLTSNQAQEIVNNGYVWDWKDKAEEEQRRKRK